VNKSTLIACIVLVGSIGSTFLTKADLRPGSYAEANTSDIPICGTPLLYNETIKLVKLYGHPKLLPMSRLPSNMEPGGFKEGERRSFWCHNFKTDSDYLIDAICQKVGTHCYVFVEEGKSITDDTLNKIVTEFDNNIYPTNTSVFGFEWKPGIDGDERIIILLLDIQDEYHPLLHPQYVAGYFHAKDEYPKSEVPHSNECEMFYMDINPGDPKANKFFGTLAHEFQHMIHWNQDADEEKWINEGCSDYATFICGYGHPAEHVNAFKDEPDTSLLEWTGSLQDYGASFLFILYLSEKYGDLSGQVGKEHFIKDLVEEDSNGIQGIDNVLEAYGYSDTFAKVFKYWVLANYLDSSAINNKYEYQHIDIHVEPAWDNWWNPLIPIGGQPVTIDGPSPVHPWAADYIRVHFLSNGFYLKSIFEGNGDSDYTIYAIYRDKLYAFPLSHSEWHGIVYIAIPERTAVVDYIVIRTGSNGNGDYKLDVVEVDKREYSIGNGLQWLRGQQNQNGSWTYSGRVVEENVGVSSLALLTFLNFAIGETDPAIDKAVSWILSQQKENGSITNGTYHIYDTSLAILALIATGNDEYYDEVKAGTDFLISAQNDEGEELTSLDWTYGGWGYEENSPDWSDLSNSQFALLALHYAESFDPNDTIVPSDVWRKAEIFITRCQNREASNPDYNFYNDGGFIYQPASTIWSGGRSYGSMTAAGLWGFYTCKVNRSDGRVKDAWNWMRANYHVDQNYPLGSQFLYYYLYSLAKACWLWNLTEIDGHDWYSEMKDLLIAKQQDDGHWPGTDADEEPDLVATCWALLALETKPSAPRATVLRIAIESPADLHLYDSEGRHVGINYDTGDVEIEIEGATYSGPGTEPQVITVPNPAGTYRVELLGREGGNYVLTFEGIMDDEVVFSQSFDGSINVGKCDVASVTVSGIAGPLTIDIREPRPVPSGLIAVPGNTVVDLSWDSYQISGFDLAGYNVYRSITEGRGYVKINSALVTETSYHDAGLNNGVTYYYVVTAVDTEGNETDHSREVSATPFADTTPPPAPTISSLTHPDQDEWYNNNDPTFNWTEPDDPSGIAGYSFVLDQTANTTPDETIDTTERTKSYTDITDGIWYFHVRAQDGAGNWGPASHYRVKIRTVFPTAEITFPEDGAAIRATVNITGSASGDHFDYYMVEYGEGENPSTWTLLFSSREPVTQGTLATWDTTQVSEGQYTIRLTVVDTYTYVVQVAVTVIVDNTPPVIQDVLPIEGDFVPAKPTITATLTDNLSGIDEDSILIKLNGSEVDPAPSFDPDTGKMTWTARASLPDGDYQVTIDVKDKAGNQAQQARTTFTISTELTIRNALNYPNPCSSGTTFTYNLSQEAQVRIEIYTLAGELIKVIEPASAQVGYNQQYWDGSDDRGKELGNGVYIYRIVAQAGGKITQAIGKLVILR